MDCKSDLTNQAKQPVHEESNVVRMEINGVLDLHGFRPCDVHSVVLEYLTECRSKGIGEVRVIHGKGKGELKRTVEALLSKIDWVEWFGPASPLYGGWGATMVRLKKRIAGGDG